MDQSPQRDTAENLIQAFLKNTEPEIQQAQQERIKRADAVWEQEKLDREERLKRAIEEQTQPRAVWERIRAEQERDETIRWLMRNCDLDDAKRRGSIWALLLAAGLLATLRWQPWTLVSGFPLYADSSSDMAFGTWAFWILVGCLGLLCGLFSGWRHWHDEIVILERGWRHEPYKGLPIPPWIYWAIDPLDLVGFTGPTAAEAARHLRDRWKRLSFGEKKRIIDTKEWPDKA